MDARTLAFYQHHCEEWAAALPEGERKDLEIFLSRLAPGGRILELGCGDGRDAQVMLARGFRVEASDGSPQMARLASQRIGQNVPVMQFDELDASEEFDGVWCHASLLHLDEDALPGVLQRIFRALKSGGHHFANYKGGTGGHRDEFGRFYSYIPATNLDAAYRAAGDWADLAIESHQGGSFGGAPTVWHNVTAQK